MRALVSTDLHSSSRARSVIEAALDEGGLDAHICLGDVVTFEPVSFVDAVLANPRVPTLSVPGNTDGADARQRMGELGTDIHFGQAKVAGVTVAGAGGCPPPPFRTAFVVEEREYERELPAVLDGADVLASHAPARGWLDSVMPGVHVGGRALREAVERFQPKVVLSGHIHQASGLVLWEWESGRAVAREREVIDGDLRGRTLLMNPGPAKDGRLGTIELRRGHVHAEVLHR